MNAPIRVLDEEIRRDRISVLLLAVFLIGAAVGAMLAGAVCYTGSYTMGLPKTEGLLSALITDLLWIFVIGVLSLHPCGTGLIPLVFFSKGMILGCRTAGIMLFSAGAGLYEVLVLYMPDILCFLLAASLIGERGVENALSLLRKRPAYHAKNLYILVNCHVMGTFLLILASSACAAFWKVYMTTILLK